MPQSLQRLGWSPNHLTRRHRECLHWMAKGLLAKEIADKMGIHVGTVWKHRAMIMSHYGVNEALPAVIKALKAGHIKLEEINL